MNKTTFIITLMSVLLVSGLIAMAQHTYNKGRVVTEEQWFDGELCYCTYIYHKGNIIDCSKDPITKATDSLKRVRVKQANEKLNEISKIE